MAAPSVPACNVTSLPPQRIHKQAKALLFSEIVTGSAAFPGTALALFTFTTGRDTTPGGHAQRALKTAPLAGMMIRKETSLDGDRPTQTAGA